MSRPAVLRYLGISDGQLKRLIHEKNLVPHKVFGTFATLQVTALARQIELQILSDSVRRITIGKEEPSLPDKSKYRTRPILEP